MIHCDYQKNNTSIRSTNMEVKNKLKKPICSAVSGRHSRETFHRNCGRGEQAHDGCAGRRLHVGEGFVGATL